MDQTPRSENERDEAAGNAVQAAPAEDGAAIPEGDAAVSEAAPTARRSPRSRRGARDRTARLLAILSLVAALGSAAYTALQGGALPLPGRYAPAQFAAADFSSDEATLLVTVDYLSDAAAGSGPFDTELAIALEMIEDRSGMLVLLDALVDDATVGVPSVSVLQTTFQSTLQTVNGTVRQQIVSNVTHGINRFVAFGAASRRREATLNRLSAMVADGDIAMAVEILQQLDGPTQRHFEGWQRSAERRARVNRLLAEIRQTAYLSILGGNT